MRMLGRIAIAITITAVGMLSGFIGYGLYHYPGAPDEASRKTILRAAANFFDPPTEELSYAQEVAIAEQLAECWDETATAWAKMAEYGAGNGPQAVIARLRVTFDRDRPSYLRERPHDVTKSERLDIGHDEWTDAVATALWQCQPYEQPRAEQLAGDRNLVLNFDQAGLITMNVMRQGKNTTLAWWDTAGKRQELRPAELAEAERRLLNCPERNRLIKDLPAPRRTPWGLPDPGGFTMWLRLRRDGTVAVAEQFRGNLGLTELTDTYVVAVAAAMRACQPFTHLDPAEFDRWQWTIMRFE